MVQRPFTFIGIRSWKQVKAASASTVVIGSSRCRCKGCPPLSIAGHATERGARVMLVAPTGRAAVRMTEASGLRARTVHSALGWIPGEGPTHDEQDPLSCDLLIVDDDPMANLELLVTLLRAVGDHPPTSCSWATPTSWPPVGAGKPFAELVACGPYSGHAPHPHLPPGRRQHDRPRGPRRSAVGRAAQPSPPPQGMRRDLFMIERPLAASGAGGDRVTGGRAPAEPTTTC